MRYTRAKTRRARRVREPLRDKDVKYLQKRNYPPGMHGQARRRLSEYGIQLLQKQKAKWLYALSERQFRRYYEAAAKKRGVTPQLLIEALELRLDNIVYRLGFASSRAQARQLVSHGFFRVNTKKVNIPSYQVRVGDQIAVRENKQNTKYFQQLLPQLKEYKPLEWLGLDGKTLSGKVLGKPTLENTGSTLEMQLIVEHYSR